MKQVVSRSFILGSVAESVPIRLEALEDTRLAVHSVAPVQALQVSHPLLATLLLRQCLAQRVLVLVQPHHRSVQQAQLSLRRPQLIHQRRRHRIRQRHLAIRQPLRATRQPLLLMEVRRRRRATHLHRLHSALRRRLHPHRQCTAQLLQCTVLPAQCMVAVVANSPRRRLAIPRRHRRTVQPVPHRLRAHHTHLRVQCITLHHAALKPELRPLLALNTPRTVLSTRQPHLRRTKNIVLYHHIVILLVTTPQSRSRIGRWIH